MNYLKESELKYFNISDQLLGSLHLNLKKYVSNELLSFCFQENDPQYCNSDFNSLHRKDTFDSDIWNNTECFTEDDLRPFQNTLLNKPKLDIYYVDNQKPYISHEEKWIKNILNSELNFKPLDLSKIVPNNSWFIVQRPHVEFLTKYFEYLKSININFKVLHISDEFEQDNIEFYTFSNCKGVIRNYLRNNIPKLPHILTIPLGYHYITNSDKTFNERELVWSFHGTNWYDRDKLIQNIISFTPHQLHFVNNWDDPNKSSETNYLEIISNSKFCPILKGTNYETFRLYEALEAGTIPIYVRIKGDELFWNYIKEKLDLIEIKSWYKAKELIDIFLKNTLDAEKYRLKIINNWKNWKNEIQNNCQKIMNI